MSSVRVSHYLLRRYPIQMPAMAPSALVISEVNENELMPNSSGTNPPMTEPTNISSNISLLEGIFFQFLIAVFFHYFRHVPVLFFSGDQS